MKKLMIPLLLVFAFLACGGDDFNASDVLGSGNDTALAVTPGNVTLSINQTQRFYRVGGGTALPVLDRFRFHQQ